MQENWTPEQAQELLQLQTKIMAAEKLPMAYAGVLANDALNHFIPEVRQGVCLWMRDELTEDFTAGDYRIGDLYDAMGLSPLATLFALNMMLTERRAAHTVCWFEKKEIMGK